MANPKKRPWDLAVLDEFGGGRGSLVKLSPVKFRGVSRFGPVDSDDDDSEAEAMWDASGRRNDEFEDRPQASPCPLRRAPP